MKKLLYDISHSRNLESNQSIAIGGILRTFNIIGERKKNKYIYIINNTHLLEPGGLMWPFGTNACPSILLHHSEASLAERHFGASVRGNSFPRGSSIRWNHV
jgi:hypothetical protein